MQIKYIFLQTNVHNIVQAWNTVCMQAKICVCYCFDTLNEIFVKEPFKYIVM